LTLRLKAGVELSIFFLFRPVGADDLNSADGAVYFVPLSISYDFSRVEIHSAKFKFLPFEEIKDFISRTEVYVLKCMLFILVLKKKISSMTKQIINDNTLVDINYKI